MLRPITHQLLDYLAQIRNELQSSLPISNIAHKCILQSAHFVTVPIALLETFWHYFTTDPESRHAAYDGLILRSFYNCCMCTFSTRSFSTGEEAEFNFAMGSVFLRFLLRRN